MNTRKGFTLVELLVVIAILAILATVSVVGYTSFIGSAEQTAFDTDVSNIETHIDTQLVLESSFVLGTVSVKYTDGEPATEKTAKVDVVITRSYDANGVEKRTASLKSLPTGAVILEDGKITPTGSLEGLSGALTYADGVITYTAGDRAHTVLAK